MTFTGFARELPQFLRELKENNDKAWFSVNRARFEDVVIAPSQKLISALAEPLSQLVPALGAVPKVDGSIRRFHRDTRFSKDKRPFNTHLHLVFWAGDHPRNSPGVHLLLNDEQFGYGAGLPVFDDGMLARYRAQVADDGGNAVAAAVTAVEPFALRLDAPALARVPLGFDASALGANWLRYKGLIAKSGWTTHPRELFGPGAVAYVADLCRSVSPLNDYIAKLRTT